MGFAEFSFDWIKRGLLEDTVRSADQHSMMASPPSGAEVLANADGIVAAPWSVRTQVSRPQVPIPGAEPVEQKVLSDPHFESLAEINRGAPLVLNADGIERPGVERLGKVLAEEEARFAEEHEAAKGPATERANLDLPGKHVACKGVA